MKKKEVTIRQPYAITLAKHRLNTHEMRVMFRIIEALQPDIQYNKDVRQVRETLFGNKIISIKTNLLLPEGSQNYSCVKRAINSLRKKDITIQKKGEKGISEVYTGMIVRGEYFLNNELVEIEVDRDLLPSFLALAKNYSKYLLNVAFNSSSPNVMKLYQYVSHHYWRNELKIEIDMEDLRGWLGIENKYPKSKDMRANILEPAMKELKEKADVYFEIKKPIKLGRKITGWEIRIFKKSFTEEELQKSRKKEGNILFYLKEHFKLRETDLIQLNEYIRSPEWQPHIWNAMLRVEKRINASHNKVKNRRLYMLQSLINELKE